MFKKLFFSFLILAFLLPSLVLADGMILPPPDRYMFETDQQGVIFFEDGVETLILSTSFRGDADNFAWVIPTPARPKVEKASKEIFIALRDLTEVQEDHPRSKGFGGVEFGLKDAMQNIHIIEQKKIEYYDITVLAADSKDALTEWLNNNDYHFPEQYSYVLDSYIKNRWFFTAVKITKDVDAEIFKQDMWNGSLIPLQLKFLTNKPVYPLRISSVIEEPSLTRKAPNHVTGKVNKAIEIKREEKISFYSNDFDMQEGSIEMWVKINQVSDKQANGTFLTVFDNSQRKEKFYFGVQGGSLQLHFYDDSFAPFNPLTWSASYSGRILSFSKSWNHVAVSWKQGESPKFYFNGTLLPVVYPSNKIIPVVETKTDYSSGQIYIGSSKFSKPLKNIYIDETKISSIARNNGEIFNNYNNDVGKKFSFDANTIAIASFDHDLTYIDRNAVNRKMAYINSAPAPRKNYYKPSQVGIELYIFTPDKEQALPGFKTRYAAWTDKKIIEDLAFNDNGKSWIEVEKKKYYLTKLSRYMKYSDMDNDLFFRDATENSDTGGNEQKSKVAFYIIICVAIFIILSVSIIIIHQFNRE